MKVTFALQPDAHRHACSQDETCYRSLPKHSSEVGGGRSQGAIGMAGRPPLTCCLRSTCAILCTQVVRLTQSLCPSYHYGIALHVYVTVTL